MADVLYHVTECCQVEVEPEEMGPTTCPNCYRKKHFTRRVVRCSCGRKHITKHNDSVCDCGKWFNALGDELRDMSEWDEDFGYDDY